MLVEGLERLCEYDGEFVPAAASGTSGAGRRFKSFRGPHLLRRGLAGVRRIMAELGVAS